MKQEAEIELERIKGASAWSPIEHVQYTKGNQHAMYYIFIDGSALIIHRDGAAGWISTDQRHSPIYTQWHKLFARGSK